jgi:hypothetical protein
LKECCKSSRHPRATYNPKGRIFESKFPIPARFGKVLFTPVPKIVLQYEASRCANPPVMTVPGIANRRNFASRRCVDSAPRYACGAVPDPGSTGTASRARGTFLEIDWSGRISKSGDAILLFFGREPPNGVADICCRGRAVEPRAIANQFPITRTTSPIPWRCYRSGGRCCKSPAHKSYPCP